MEVARQYVRDDDRVTDWNALSMTAATYYSEAIKVRRAEGLGSILFKRTGGTTDIEIEVSDDGVNWYIPYDKDGASLGDIAIGINQNRWIQFTIPVAEFIRFKLVQKNATSTNTVLFRRRSLNY